MREVSLIPGADGDGAFCLTRMKAAGVDSMVLSQAMAKSLTTFAALLRDGHGFAVVIGDDGDASIIGISIEEVRQ